MSLSGVDDLAQRIHPMGLKDEPDGYVNRWNLSRVPDDDVNDDAISLDSSRPVHPPALERTDPQYTMLPVGMTVGSFTESLASSSQGSSFSTITEKSVSQHYNDAVEATDSAYHGQELVPTRRQPLEPSDNTSQLDTIIYELTHDIRLLERLLIRFLWLFELTWRDIGCCCEGPITHTHGHLQTVLSASQVSGCSKSIGGVSADTHGFHSNFGLVQNGDTYIDLTRPDHRAFYLDCVLEAKFYARGGRVGELFHILPRVHAPQRPVPGDVGTGSHLERTCTNHVHGGAPADQLQKVVKSRRSKRGIVNNGNGSDEEEEDAHNDKGGGRKVRQRSTSTRYACIFVVRFPLLYHRCGEVSFEKISDLKTHLKQNHDDQEPRACALCKKVFSFQRLREHQSQGVCHVRGNVLCQPNSTILSEREDRNLDSDDQWFRLYKSMISDDTSNTSPFYMPYRERLTAWLTSMLPAGLSASLVLLLKQVIFDMCNDSFTEIQESIPESSRDAVCMRTIYSILRRRGAQVIARFANGLEGVVSNSIADLTSYVGGWASAYSESNDTLASGQKSILDAQEWQETRNEESDARHAYPESLEFISESFPYSSDACLNQPDGNFHQPPALYEEPYTAIDDDTGVSINMPYICTNTNTEQEALPSNGSIVYTGGDDSENPCIDPACLTYAENEHPYSPNASFSQFLLG